MQLKNIELPQDRIDAFCRRWKVVELALFGSVLRDDFRPDSDVDVLVTFAADAHWSLFDFIQAQDELADILERSVDLVERQAVEESRNYIRRKHILSTLQPVYAG